MKTYLRISAVVFLLVGVFHTLIIISGGQLALHWSDSPAITMVPTGLNWSGAAVAYVMALFGLGLSMAVGHRDRCLKKREDELSSLIEILQDGRKQQMAMMGVLSTKTEPEPTESVEKDSKKKEPPTGQAQAFV